MFSISVFGDFLNFEPQSWPQNHQHRIGCSMQNSTPGVRLRQSIARRSRRAGRARPSRTGWRPSAHPTPPQPACNGSTKGGGCSIEDGSGRGCYSTHTTLALRRVGIIACNLHELHTGCTMVRARAQNAAASQRCLAIAPRVHADARRADACVESCDGGVISASVSVVSMARPGFVPPLSSG